MKEHENKDYVNINKTSLRNNFILKVKHKLCKNDGLIVKCTEDIITIERPGMSYTGKLFKPSKGLSGWYGVSIKSDFTEVGKYLIDKDESNEDKIVIYLEDKV